MIGDDMTSAHEDLYGFDEAVSLAIKAAKTVSSDVAACRKSRRGVAIWRPEQPLIIVTGTNRRADGRVCSMSDECKRDCARICVHAEQAALIDFLRIDFPVSLRARPDPEVVHVKVVDGALVPSGGPSCVECSKLMKRAGVAAVHLFHESGWKKYRIHHFHEETLVSLKLHGSER